MGLSPGLEGLLDDLAGTHPGIDMIRHGMALLFESELTVDERKGVLYALAGAQGLDLVSAIGIAVHDLTTAPALAGHPNREQLAKEGHQAEAATYFWPEREHVTAAIALLDRPRGGAAVTDDERKELSRKVKKINDETRKRPR